METLVSSRKEELAARVAPFIQMIAEGLTELAQATWGTGGFTLRAATSHHRRWVHAGIFGAEEVELEGRGTTARPDARSAVDGEVGYRVYLLLDRQRRPARFGFGDDGPDQARWTWYREQCAWERQRETRDLSPDGLRALLRACSALGPEALVLARRDPG